MSVAREPVAFEVCDAGVYLHGTKADLAVGELLVPGRESNFEEGRVMNYVYFTATLDAATWGAELAAGAGRGRIYIVDPSGEFEDDPNVTNKRFPGIRRNPSAPASRCASSASSSTGSVTPRRSCRPCATDLMR
jgi:rifampin ADP-ribosylating transferase